MYTRSKYPWGPDFDPFHSTTNQFRDTSLSKVVNVPHDLTLTSNINMESILSVCTVYLHVYPRETIFGSSFHSMHSTRRFRDTRLLKIEKSRKCTEWPQSDFEHLTVKVLCLDYIYLHSRLKFGSVSLYDQPFSRCKAVDNRKKRHMGLGALLGHLQDRHKLGL